MKTFFRCLLVFLSILLSSVAVEILLRQLNYQYYPMHIQVLGETTYGDSSIPKTDYRYFHIFKDQAFEYDPQLLWRPNPNYKIYRNGKTINFFNALGYPGPLFISDNAEGRYRIIALGDSNTLGIDDYDLQTGREISWPAYLGNILGDKFFVINGGVWGYSSYQIQQKFYSALKYNPSMIIVSGSSNDTQMVGVSDRHYSLAQIAEIQLLMRSKFAQLVQAGLDKVRHNSSVLTPRVSREEYREILYDLINQASLHSIQLILLTRPYAPETKIGLDITPYNTITKEVASEKSIPVLDVQENFATQSSLFVDDTHFSGEGLRLMAQFVSDELRRDGIIANIDVLAQ